MNQSRKDFLAIAFLALLITAFFAGEIFTDQTLVTFRLTNAYPWLAEASPEEREQPSVTSDCTFSYYPRRVFATRMIRDGNVPFWNPHQFCGTPFLATFQTMVFYPVNIPLYALDPPAQMDIFIYLHFLIAAVFGYLLGRKLKMSAPASVVTSITYTFCGFMVTRYGQPTFISTASWLPAVLFFGEHLIERPSFRRMGLLGLIVSLSILAGFPQLVMITIYALLGYMLMRVIMLAGRPRRARVAIMLAVLAAVGVACLVSAFQLLPTYELSRFSFRKVLPYEMVLSSAHHRLVSLKYFIPDILGHPRGIGVLSTSLKKVAVEPAFRQNYVSTTGYVGVLPLLLALLALSKPRKRLIPFIVLSVLALLVVFGSPLLKVFYRLLPGFNFSRIDRVIVLYMISMAALAGYGFDVLRGGLAPKRSLFSGIGFLAFAAVLAGWLFTSGFDMIHGMVGAEVSREAFVGFVSGKVYWFVGLAALSSLLVIFGRRGFRRSLLVAGALGVMLLDLVPNGMGFKVTQPAGGIMPASRLVDALKADTGRWRFMKFKGDIIPSNTATILSLDDAHGYDALNINHYIELVGAVDSTVTHVSNAALRRRIGPVVDQRALDSKILDLLNVRYVLTLGERQGRWRRPAAIVNRDHLSRAFLVGRPRFFESYETMLEYMKTGAFDPAGEVLLLAGQGGPPDGSVPEAALPEAGGVTAGGPVGAAVDGSVETLTYGPNGMDYRVETREECYLVFSEVYYPGWRAFVDGDEQEMLRADYALRAIRLGPGVHSVKVRYTPLYFRIGLLLSLAGLGLLAVLIASGRRLTLDPGRPAA
jgi:hypothetical protein